MPNLLPVISLFQLYPNSPELSAGSAAMPKIILSFFIEDIIPCHLPPLCVRILPLRNVPRPSWLCDTSFGYKVVYLKKSGTP